MNIFKRESIQADNFRKRYVVFHLDDEWLGGIGTIIRQEISTAQVVEFIKNGGVVNNNKSEKQLLLALETFLKIGSLKKGRIKTPLGFSDTILLVREVSPGAKTNVAKAQFTFATYMAV